MYVCVLCSCINNLLCVALNPASTFRLRLLLVAARLSTCHGGRQPRQLYASTVLYRRNSAPSASMVTVGTLRLFHDCLTGCLSVLTLVSVCDRVEICEESYSTYLYCTETWRRHKTTVSGHRPVGGGETVSRAEGWASVASGLEAEPTPPESDMSSRTIGLGFSGAARTMRKRAGSTRPKPRPSASADHHKPRTPRHRGERPQHTDSHGGFRTVQ